MDWNRVGRRVLGRSVPLLMAAALLTFGCRTPIRIATPESTRPQGVSAAELAELWVDRGDPARLDLFHGPADPALAPRPGARFFFLEKDTTGFSRGYDVKDESGLEWSSKHGLEAQTEVVASRILWALGYHQPPTYYVERWQLVGGDRPGPGMPSRFRPKLPTQARGENWLWHRNPFVDTQPFRGLLVLMRLLNNWDLRHQNNYVYEVKGPDGPRRWYVVQDLGATFGKTKIVPIAGTRNDAEDFEEQGFIKGVSSDGIVRFDDLGRNDRRLFRDVTVADVRWLCARLDRITPQQWQDAFRAARYDRAVADRFIRRIQDKVRAGLILEGPVPRTASAGR
jgi:hypothetical protein